MIDITTITVLLPILLAQVYLLKKLRQKSIVLIASLLFASNVFLLIVLIGSFHRITEPQTISSNSVDLLVYFNSYSTRTINSIIIIGLLFLAYGFYDQYSMTRKRTPLFLSYSIAGISLLLFIAMLMAGNFII